MDTKAEAGHSLDDFEVEYGVTLLDPAALIEAWGFLEPHIDFIANTSEGKASRISLTTDIIAGNKHVWLVARKGQGDAKLIAMAMGQVMQYPDKFAYRIVAQSGPEFERWAHLLELVEEWVHAQGIPTMQVEAAADRIRPVMRQGYRRTHVLLEKELESYDA